MSRSNARWRRAVDDAGVRAILLDIDSPGGETTGCFELADYIYSIRGIKPVYAAANDIALSAAYAIASAASRVFVTRTGAVGSVGVYALHVDQSGVRQGTRREVHLRLRRREEGRRQSARATG